MAVSKAAGRELGAQLKAIRNAAGLTLRQVADLVTVSNPTISNWENGNRLPSTEDLSELLDALGIEGDECERLLGLRHQADDAPGQILAGAPSIGPQLAQLIDHEQRASRILNWAPLLIPGLLQTAEYARAIMGDAPDAETRVKLRRGRQDVLTRRRDPVELLAMLDSEVLVRPVAPQDVMGDQLRHLLDMAERPNVTVQIMSSTQPGWHPGLAGPFQLIEFPTARPIVHAELHSSSLFLWEEEDVKKFMEAAERIRTEAMTSAESAEVIEGIVNGWTETT